MNTGQLLVDMNVEPIELSSVKSFILAGTTHAFYDSNAVLHIFN